MDELRIKSDFACLLVNQLEQSAPMSTLFEAMRGAHEEIERLEDEAGKVLMKEPKTQRETVAQAHRLKQLVGLIVDKRNWLADYYEDSDGQRRSEIASIGGNGPALFAAFYERIREAKVLSIDFLLLLLTNNDVGSS